MYPTVYMLWQHPGLLHTFTTHPPVISVLAGGADLMLPGIVTKGEASVVCAGGGIVGLVHVFVKEFFFFVCVCVWCLCFIIVCEPYVVYSLFISLYVSVVNCYGNMNCPLLELSVLVLMVRLLSVSLSCRG